MIIETRTFSNALEFQHCQKRQKRPRLSVSSESAQLIDFVLLPDPTGGGFGGPLRFGLRQAGIEAAQRRLPGQTARPRLIKDLTHFTS